MGARGNVQDYCELLETAPLDERYRFGHNGALSAVKNSRTAGAVRAHRPTCCEMRLAIVSDPIVQRGGAERMLEIIANAFPEAPIFAVLYSPQSGPSSFASRVVPSWLNRIPGATRRHRFLLPLYQAAIESFDLSGYDVILTMHHTVAKGVLRSAEQFNLCYCHTPMKALWERPFEERRTMPAPVRPIIDLVMHVLRLWDYATAGRVDRFLANSSTTQLRIAKHYGRESTILSPPIDTDRFVLGDREESEDYYLFASRLVPYKRVDLAIAATAALGRRVVVVGTGPGVKSVVGSNVDYRGHVSDDELVRLMQGARAMIFPAFEDFGMAMVEMMACGRPVIAYGRGGACDTVIDGVTGVLVPEQTVEAFVRGLRRAEGIKFSRNQLRAHAEAFSALKFIERLKQEIENSLLSHSSRVIEQEPTSAVLPDA